MELNESDWVRTIENQVKLALFSTVDYVELSDAKLKERIDQLVDQIAQQNEQYMSLSQKFNIEKHVFSDVRGLGILDELMVDDSITEIMINGKDTIFIEKFGKLIKSHLYFETQEQLDDLIQKIVGLVGREVNLAQPIVDARLLDGSRINIVLHPVAIVGPVVTIRKFTKQMISIEKLVSLNAITEESAQFLMRCVKGKYNILISGGTGSGKTTFLNALSQSIPKEERIISIEDSAELQLFHLPNCVKLEARNANSANFGKITIRDLIKTALRMRPERIIVGEVRSEEALDMLQAMNTGHDGSLSTVHANSAIDALSRLETMVLMGNVNLPLLAIRQQIASSIDIIVHLSRFRDGTRKVKEIVELLPLNSGEYQINQLFQFQETIHSNDAVVGTLVKINPLKNEQKIHINNVK